MKGIKMEKSNNKKKTKGKTPTTSKEFMQCVCYALLLQCIQNLVDE